MIRRAFLAALLVTLVGGLLSFPEPAGAAPLTRYYLDTAIEYDAGIVTTSETVAFTNRSSTAWESLVFNVTPGYYGAFKLLRVAVNGREVKGVLDSAILDVPLPEPVQPGLSAVAILDFRIEVPFRHGRFGRGSQVMALGNWFPTLAVYRDGRLVGEGQRKGWVRAQYVEIGDAFFAEAADFTVALRTDRRVSVAHTGDTLSQGENTWRFEARGVRDFAMAVSPSFSTVSRQVDGVDVSVFYVPGHEASADSYLRAAAAMLSWMNRITIPYPYRTLQLAEVNAEGSTTIGQEYPNLIFMADNIASTAGPIDSYGSVLAMHEVGHQWFYGMVGNDQLYDPWLDEAMVTWLSDDYLRAHNVPSFPAIWQSRVVSPAVPDLPANAGIYDYADEGTYLSLAYRRGALFLEDLYKAMGEEAFFDGLAEYTATLAGRIATPYAFLDTMQAHTSANLNPLIARYFSYKRYRASQPLRVSSGYPQEEWSEPVRIELESDAALRDVQIFIDDALYTKDSPANLVVDTSELEEGPHLLTIRASDGQREVDVVGTFTVVHLPPAPTPTPPPVISSPEASHEQPAPAPVAEPLRPVVIASDTEPKVGGAALILVSLAVFVWSLVKSNKNTRR